MKYFKYLLIVNMLTFLFLVGCKKEEVNSIKVEFTIKNLEGNEIQHLEPALLKAVNKNLLEQGRKSDALELMNKYDPITGYLKGAKIGNSNLPERNVLIDSSKFIKKTDTIPSSKLKALSYWEPNAVKAAGHVEGIGDVAGVYQSQSLMPGDICGTTMNYARLEAFMLTLEPQFMQNPNEKPVLYYTGQFANNTWAPTQTWGGWAGTKGQNKALKRMKMWFTYGYSNYHIFYLPHNEAQGWAVTYSYDGQAAGTERRLEAFSYYILKY